MSPAAQAAGPPPGSLEYIQRETRTWPTPTGGTHSSSYPEPVDVGRWEPIDLDRSQLLSLYFCSAYGIRGRTGEFCS